MRLYHFTTEWHWRRIQHSGVLRTTESNASMLTEHAAPDVVWFSDSPEPADQRAWIAVRDEIREFAAEQARLAVRIAVDVADAEPWLSWMERYVTLDEVWIEGLGGREAASHWYVVERPVPEAEWGEVEILLPPRGDRMGDHFMLAELARWEAIGNGIRPPSPNLEMAVRYDSVNGPSARRIVGPKQLAEYQQQWDGLAPYVARAETWFVSAPMAALIDEASLSVPDYSVEETDFPSRDSFVYLAQPWLIPTGKRQRMVSGAPVTEGRVLVIQAFSLHVQPGAPKAVVSLYSRDRAQTGSPDDQSAFARDVPGSLAYCGVSTFPIGAPWSATLDARPALPMREQQNEAVDGVMFSRDLYAHVAAFATVINQRITTRTTRQIPRAPRRQLQHKGFEPGDVHVITLRAHDYTYDDAQYLGEMAGRYLSVRFIVRGHWRDQPYGVGRGLRRKQWIESYVKGPDDAPLRLHVDRLFDVSR